MLFEPARHEALRDVPWDEAVARSTIAAIVDDAGRCDDARTYWPSHPADRGADEPADLGTTPLYFGACGVLWGLRYLESIGHARVARTDEGTLETLLTRHRDWLRREAIEHETASYLMGDTPIRLMAFEADPGDARAATLERLIADNVDHPSREPLWGAPGTMLAALFLFEKTADARWAALFRRTAEVLWDRLEWSDEHGCFHWTQDMYGKRSTYLGAGHGFAGNVLPLIRGRHLLSSDAWSAWEARIVGTIAGSARRDDGFANWYAQLTPPADPSRWLVQWCHGAPGVVISLADLPGEELDDLLLAAGALTWHAGPLNKGAGLCHGTGGNGYAFLKLYRRTGDETWLRRARAFAMHGIGQVAADRERHGQGRHSLWTGDIGFAIYLADCIDARASFPTLDVFWTRP